MTKMFKRLILSTAAISMLAMPMAQAQTRHQDTRQGHHITQKKHQDVKRHSWKRGERVSDWRKRQAISDYKRHGLRNPGKNQRWVKVDNSYLLISLATGLVAGVVVSR